MIEKLHPDWCFVVAMEPNTFPCHHVLHCPFRKNLAVGFNISTSNAMWSTLATLNHIKKPYLRKFCAKNHASAKKKIRTHPSGLISKNK
jgi:hypothetical protein